MWRSNAAEDTTSHREGLRLALFSGNYNYTRDGANQALNRLVRHLEQWGVTARIYSPTTATPAFPPAGTLISAPSVAAPGRKEYRLSLGLTPRLRRDLIAFRPDIVHLAAPDLLGLQAQRFARRIGAPVVASLHTRFETYLSYYGLGLLRPALERYLAGFYGGCDRVLTPNKPMAALLEGQGLGSRARVWGRGVDRVQFAPERRDPAWRRSQGFGDDDVVVLFVGRLVMEKGLDVFARTLALLRDRQPRVRALIVGDGPARDAFQRALPDGVFAGVLVGEDLGRAVSSADILFNPSLTETFGNVTLEAMAAGLAVVCAEAPSTHELLAAGQDGIVVEQPDPAAYAEAIAALAVDQVARHRLGRAARAASARYDWTVSSRAVLDVYREVTGQAPLRPTAVNA